MGCFRLGFFISVKIFENFEGFIEETKSVGAQNNPAAINKNAT
jgi:hypothetical protein